MKKFKVKVAMTSYLDAEIEADTIEDAYSIARDMAGADFHLLPYVGDWNVYDVEEIDE